MAPSGDDGCQDLVHGVVMHNRHEELPQAYEIHVGATIDHHWSEWFDDMAISTAPGGTVIAGEVADQAALHGLLTRVRDLGLEVISVRRVDRTTEETS